ncbi:hypothetical protein SprV_0702328600 [Sparganum proliferum]
MTLTPMPNCWRSLGYFQRDRLLPNCVGDFNAPHINWSSASADCSDAAFDQQLLRTSDNLLLTQHVMFPTRVREGQQMNCLDLVFTKSSDNIDVVNCLPPLGQSDHVVLMWEYTLFYLPSQPLDSRPNIWRGDFEQMRKDLSPIDWESTLSGDVEEDWCRFKELVHNLISNHCPIMRRRLTNRPRWLTPSLKKEVNKKRKLWKRCLADRTPESLSSYKLQRNRVKILIARDRKAFEKDLLNRAMVNPKVLYSYIRQSTRNKDPIPLLRTAEGMEISDDKDKAENLSQFFRSVVASEPAFFSPFCEDDETPTLEAVFFTEAIVRNELLNLKESTSPGPDAIPAKLLKELAPEMSKPLAVIFQTSFLTGCLPSDWKSATITPLFKGGSRASANNYRPVSLTSICCKIMEKIIKKALMQFLEHTTSSLMHNTAFEVVGHVSRICSLRSNAGPKHAMKAMWCTPSTSTSKRPSTAFPTNVSCTNCATPEFVDAFLHGSRAFWLDGPKECRSGVNSPRR